ncbi:MAG: orotate phosphoribosyltransferase [Magnetococcales bacterium]|nr:orotate phosphoribosyltransferase [Magnetococcales bacterium]
MVHTLSSSRSEQFLRFAMDEKILLFGEFTTKAGRCSPYFFNAGLFNSGRTMARLARHYADTIQESGMAFDMIFGPAYKGIPLAVATAMALADHHGRDIPFTFNRKSVKEHGEGGSLVGAPLQGRVLIIDDVISAGTSIRESVDRIHAANAQPAGVVIALDRQERGSGDKSAVQEITELYHMPVLAIARLTDLLALLGDTPEQAGTHAAILAYRQRYGTETHPKND